MPLICRDCFFTDDLGESECPACGSRRVVAHAELGRLAIAHLDCDAFYAAVEQRDDPSLAGKPVLVGGRHRGVVAACSYEARRFGIHSAMPMFKALKLCPDAVVIRPDFAKYAAVGRDVRALMRAVTPLVEPISIDEAFLDLAGTERVHGGAPARTLARLARRIEDEVRITVSIGLSYNKFLAKVASNLDKPRGFAVIGRAEAVDFLRRQPVAILWGVGKALQRRLARDGIATIGDLQGIEEQVLVARYGQIGHRLARFSRGRDERAVDPHETAKSISAETTLDADLESVEALRGVLWPLCEKVSTRLKRAGLAGGGVVLKLKSASFRLRTRSRRLADPTQMAETIYEVAGALLARETDGTRFRLIGVGVEHLVPGAEGDPPDPFDPARDRRVKVERTMDELRERFGKAAIAKGRGLDRAPN